MRPALLLVALLPGCARAPAVSVPEADLGALVRALGSEDARVRQDATARLRARGEAALPELERAKGGTDASLAAQARRVSEGIQTDLTDREREADDRFLLSTPPELPEGTWIAVANGRLAASGPSEEAVLDAAPSARHRYLWRSGEDLSHRKTELGSLAPGDYGLPVLEALGRGPLVGLARSEDWAALGGSAPEGWDEAAAAVSGRDARRLGLPRFELPGTVSVRSRVGAGLLWKARRARALARASDGSKTLEVTVWILEDRE